MGWFSRRSDDKEIERVKEREKSATKEWPSYPTLEHLQEEPETVQLSTAPYDPRHPNTNQTRHCFQNYVNYHRCKRFMDSKGEVIQKKQLKKNVFPLKGCIKYYVRMLGMNNGMNGWRRTDSFLLGSPFRVGSGKEIIFCAGE